MSGVEFGVFVRDTGVASVRGVVLWIQGPSTSGVLMRRR